MLILHGVQRRWPGVIYVVMNLLSTHFSLSLDYSRWLLSTLHVFRSFLGEWKYLMTSISNILPTSSSQIREYLEFDDRNRICQCISYSPSSWVVLTHLPLKCNSSNFLSYPPKFNKILQGTVEKRQVPKWYEVLINLSFHAIWVFWIYLSRAASQLADIQLRGNFFPFHTNLQFLELGFGVLIWILIGMILQRQHFVFRLNLFRLWNIIIQRRRENEYIWSTSEPHVSCPISRHSVGHAVGLFLLQLGSSEQMDVIIIILVLVWWGLYFVGIFQADQIPIMSRPITRDMTL